MRPASVFSFIQLSNFRLSKNLVLEYLDTINAIVVQVERALWEYLPEITDGKRPWQNTYNN